MHILDFIMYFVCAFILWKILELISNKNLTEEIGSLYGMLIMIIFTIVYIGMFAWPGEVDWIDIFQGKYNGNLHKLFKL